jgi:hypothetical protein
VPDTVLGFNGTFQTDREVNGVRIKDKLHIFTGTYPLYYKGDGQLYIYPQYQPNVDQILRFGHNMLMDDFDERYRFNDTVEDLDVGESEIGNTLEVKKVDFIPRFPYEGSPINLKVSYTRPPITGEVSRFLPAVPSEQIGIKYYEDFDELNIDSLPIGTIVYVNRPISAGGNFGQIGFFRVVSGTQSVTVNPGGAFSAESVELSESFIRCPFSSNKFTVTKDNVEVYGPNTIDENVERVCEGELIVFEYRESLFRNFRILNTTSGSIVLENRTSATFRVEGLGKKLEIVQPTPLLQEFFVRVYERPAAGEFGFDASDWEEIPEYTTTLVSNRATAFDNDLGPFIKNEDDEDNDNEVTQIYESTDFDENIDVFIPGLQAIGTNRDLRVDVVVRTRGFKAVPISNNVGKVQFVDEEQVASTRIFDFPVLPEKIENYPTQDNPTRTFHLHAPWTCNKVIEHFGKIIAYGSRTMPDNMFISAPEDVSLFYFPHLFRKEFLTDQKERLESVIPFSNILVAQTANRTWGVKGNSSLVFLDENAQVENPNAYRVFDINTAVGTIAHKSVRPVRNQLYFLSNQGIMSLVSLYATDDKYNVRPLDRNINNIVPLDSKAVAIQHDNQYWISFPKTGQTFRYYIDTQAWVKDSFENFEEFNGWFWVDTNNGILRFITRPMIVNENDNYTVYEGIIDKSLPTDFGKNIKSKFLTANLDQDQPFHTKRYRELKFGFALQNQFLPPLEPLPIVENEENTDEFTVQFDVKKNHIYRLELPIKPVVQQLDIDLFDADLEVISNNVPYDIENNAIILQPGLFDGTVIITVEDLNNVLDFRPPQELVENETNFVVTDVTYDFNIQGFVTADSDGNIINRAAFSTYENQKEAFDQSLGTRFSEFELGETPFGDIKRNVQTVRLSGSGYQLALALEDESRSKWTLESLGIQFRMRKTRSR